MKTQTISDVRVALEEEGGQAILLLLMVAVTMLVFLSLMYHTGTVIIVKMKIQNTADVAALSAAAVQARGMGRMAELNREIVELTVDANRNTWKSGVYFEDEDEVETYLEDNWFWKIEDRLDAIEQLQNNVPVDAFNMARSVAQRNLGSAVTVSWKAPSLSGGKLVELKNPRKESRFWWVKEDSSGDKSVEKYRARTYYEGKTDKIVYAAVEVKARNLPLGDSIFSSSINEMVAYAAAKPYGGSIGGCKNPIDWIRIRWDVGVLPRTANVDRRFWGWPCNVYPWNNMRDYNAWFVAIGDSRLDPRPTSIPNYGQFYH